MTLDLVCDPAFFFQPDRYRHEKRLESSWSDLGVSAHKPRKLGQGLVVKSDKVDVAFANFPRFQAIANRMAGQSRIAFSARESLLLCCRDDLAIANKTAES